MFRTVWVQVEILLLRTALESQTVRDSGLVLMQKLKCGSIISEVSSNIFSFNNSSNRLNNNKEIRAEEYTYCGFF